MYYVLNLSHTVTSIRFKPYLTISPLNIIPIVLFRNNNNNNEYSLLIHYITMYALFIIVDFLLGKNINLDISHINCMFSFIEKSCFTVPCVLICRFNNDT